VNLQMIAGVFHAHKTVDEFAVLEMMPGGISACSVPPPPTPQPIGHYTAVSTENYLR
jgi:hypothetical protein